MSTSSLLLVAGAVATATVLFQTVSGNRILTPAIMGFDELYRLIQTGIVVAAGTQRVALISRSAMLRNVPSRPCTGLSMAMNHCGVLRKITGFFERHECGY